MSPTSSERASDADGRRVAGEADRTRLGERCFLFTDIQSSTELWATHTDEMVVALSEHNATFDRLIREAGGDPLRTSGDGVLAMFSVPADAVTAAIDIQRWLAARSWAGIGHLRVRMGLHCGEPVALADGEITGPVVNETARLHDAGHGGQVLVSDRFARRLGDDGPLGAALVSLGSIRLRNLAPTVVHQLCHPELERDFPPLRGAAGANSNLVGRASTFVGRTAELAELGELSAQRVVTLVGPGGVGKTRLAQIWLAREAAQRRDGGLLVDLGSIARGEEVAAAVATTLRLEHGGAEAGSQLGAVQARVEEFLASKDFVLGLDNCEHVLDGVVPLLMSLLQSAPLVSVICTSREPLGLRDEHVFAIAPLAATDSRDGRPAEAVQLFVDRAKEADTSFSPTTDQLALIGSICRQLDGLPLAIEIAAARMRVDGLAQIADAVDAMRLGPSLLRPTAARHESLEAVIGWSYRLLDVREQELFRRLAVFVGPFTVEAVEHVCCDGLDLDSSTLRRVLGALVARSVVANDTEAAKLRLLAPVRAVAERLLSTAERRALRARFVAWFSEWAHETERRLRSVDEAAASDALESQFANLRAAHRRALELGMHAEAAAIVTSLMVFAIHRFHFEVVTWAEQSLADERTSDADRPALHGVCGVKAWMQGDLDLALRHADAAVTHASTTHQDVGAPMIYARMVRLAVYGYHGDFARAYVEYQEAESTARTLDDPFWIIEVLVFSAVGMATQGVYELASAYALQAADVARRPGTPPSAVAWTHYAVAEAVHQDDEEMALGFLEAAAELARSVRNEWIVGLVQLSLARLFRRVGRVAEAGAAIAEDLDRWLRAGNWSEQWRTIRETGQLAAAIGDAELAATLTGAAKTAPSVIPMSPREAAELATVADSLRSTLGEDAFTRLSRRGAIEAAARPEAVVARAQRVAELACAVH